MAQPTNLDVQNFVKQWSPAANAAAAQLKIPASFILAQWGMETAWGTQPGMGQNNPGNIMTPSGNPKPFSSVAAFISEYVPTMRGDFKSLHNPKNQPTLEPPLNSPIIYLNQIYGDGYVSGMPYSSTASSTQYANDVSGAWHTMLRATKQNASTIDNWLNGKGTAIASIPDKQTDTSQNVPTASKQAVNGVGNAITSATKSITSTLKKGAIVFATIILGIVALLMLSLPSITKAYKEVKP